MVADAVFYLLASVAVLSSFFVITAKNPIYSVLFLILAFFNVAGLFVLIGAEFLAMLLVIVYVGAVAVLFLFVVMMLNVDASRKERTWSLHHLILGATLAAVLIAELLLVLQVTLDDAKTLAFVVSGDVDNVRAIGRVLYTDYVYVFQLAGLVLLVAMIGAIVLTHRRRDDVLRQSVPNQLERDPNETIDVVTPEVGKGVKL